MGVIDGQKRERVYHGVRDVLRSFPAPPYAMPDPVSPNPLPPAPPNSWVSNAPNRDPFPEHPFISMVEINDGIPTITPQPSVQLQGSFDKDKASGISITGEDGCINTVVVNSGSYSISDLTLRLRGDGLNDFQGLGAGVMARGSSVVELRDSDLETIGVIRPCTFVTDDATIKVYNSRLKGNGGDLEADYVPAPGEAMKAPTGLELEGNCRAHLCVGKGNAFFYDSQIIAGGWGALSTDACCDHLYLEANNCDIVCKGPGYGVYADDGCEIRFNGCRIKTGHSTAILAGNSAITLDGCEAVTGKNWIMMHCIFSFTSAVCKLYVKDCSITAGQTPIVIMSSNAYIRLENTSIHSPDQTLIRSEWNDDIHTTAVGDGEENLYGIKVAVKDSALSGDIIHEDPERTMALTLTDANLSGAVKNAYLTFAGNSRWTATGDSSVNLVDVSDISAIDALPGVTIHAVAGKGTVLSGQHTLPSGGLLLVSPL